VKRVPPALAAQRLHVKISRATLPASAAIRVRVSSGRSAAADATVDAIAVADARIAAEADRQPWARPDRGGRPGSAADRVSNAVPAAVPGMTVVIREAVPVRRAARSSFPKC